MFSPRLFVKIFIFSPILLVMIFIPKMTHAAVQTVKMPINPMPDKGIKAKTSNESDFIGSRGVDENAEFPLFEPALAITDHPEDWQSWDVVPRMSTDALAIYERGLVMGNNPHSFSKIGDGEISAEWFLTDFDLGSDYYDLGPYVNLQNSIEYFAGSFGRQSKSAHRGFNTSKVLDPTLADAKVCLPGETPLDCELRLHRPSFALISMGTNQVWQPDEFENGMIKIIEILINKGIVPILSTKADNLEGDNRINLTIAQLADEYDIPLWNFWRAVQALPDQGLQQDREHLTYFPNTFSIPSAMEFSWPTRNLSALQVLDTMRMSTVR
jgi:hypothetical protein